jgi:hypothetical protein
MRFDFHTSWLRVVIEFLPRAVPLRRYRLACESVACQARRRMARRIQRQLRTDNDYT